MAKVEAMALSVADTFSLSLRKLPWRRYLLTSHHGPKKGLKSPNALLTIPAINRKTPKRKPCDIHPFFASKETNATQLRWDDIKFAEAYFHCRGTKTDEFDEYLPLALSLIDSLKKHREASTSDYVFPGQSALTKRKKIYSRRRLFEKNRAANITSRDCSNVGIGKRRHCQDCGKVEALSRMQRCSNCTSTNVSEAMACLARGSSNIKPGVNLRAKDLRDYFASIVQTDDPRVLMSLMRHTNLTTIKSLQTWCQRTKEAVSGLGKISGNTSENFFEGNYGGKLGPLTGAKCCEKSDLLILPELLKRALGGEIIDGKFGGGGRNRTYDAADMSRVL